MQLEEFVAAGPGSRKRPSHSTPRGACAVASQSPSKGPFAVVTGASSGIGYELAAEFARHGFDVLAADENEEIEDAARQLAEDGAAVEAFCVDLATDHGAEALYRKIRSSGKPVDVIAINAGLGVNGPFAGTSLRAQLNVVNLNVTSVVHLIHYIACSTICWRAIRVRFFSLLRLPGQRRVRSKLLTPPPKHF